MKMTGCRPVFYYASSQTYAGDGSEQTETVWHAVGYPPAERAAVISLHRPWDAASQIGRRRLVWSIWNEHECRWQIRLQYQDQRQLSRLL